MKTITEITRQKPTPPQIRLAAYCRVSSDSSDQLHSFAAQIKYYSEYCKRHPEYKFVDIYADEGITGTSMEKRDDFRRMLRDCKKGLIDRIIVKSMSRFARNTEEMLTALRALEQKKKLHRSRQSATRIFRELEYSGLIIRKKQGLGKPAVITLNYPADARLIMKEDDADVG